MNKAQHFKITGYSTALFSTWFFLEDFGLLFDAGDGVMANLLQKSRKIKHVFISHADRDHLGGLFQFYQLNVRKDFPVIHYPADCGSFPAMQSFLEKFDPHLKGSVWKGIEPKVKFEIKKGIAVESIRNGHVIIEEDKSKSLSYMVVHHKQKLKAEFLKLSGKEIAKIAKEKGRNAMSEEIRENWIGYSGDTPVEDYERWNDTKVLIHEATFLTDEPHLNNHRNKHSNLQEVMKMVATINVEKLILTHFSSRYSKEDIDRAILKACKTYNVTIPVYRVLPGEVVRDILSTQPVN